jgi:ribosomal protein L22
LKLLNSAIASAENNFKLKKENLLLFWLGQSRKVEQN